MYKEAIVNVLVFLTVAFALMLGYFINKYYSIKTAYYKLSYITNLIYMDILATSKYDLAKTVYKAREKYDKYVANGYIDEDNK